jgi:phosphonoacetate hydrolase
VDGGDPAYFEDGRKSGVLNHIARFMSEGYYGVGQCVIPSFTNPNNMSIVTGAPASVHGISGNYFLDPETKEAVMMNNPKYLRSETLLGLYSQAGGKVVAITAKDKLSKLLGHGVNVSNGSIYFSSEAADKCTKEVNGISNVLEFVGKPLPDVYSAELSLFVLEAGLKILQDPHKRPDIMYLSLTDYIQHKAAPGSDTSNDFYKRLDTLVGEIAKQDVVIGITADHGMNDKSNPDGTPKVIFLQDELEKKFGTGSTQVICPITDPYVVHHGALGGFVRVYCADNLIKPVKDYIQTLSGIDHVLTKSEAVNLYELPADREADLVVIGDHSTVIGSSAKTHDLSALKGERLRSHGSTSESATPLIISQPIDTTYAETLKPLRNYHIFDLVLNHLK